MNIFISWSGERSKYIAESIRLWLPKVIQAVTPWMSNEDIDSGKRWSSDIMTELENSKFGIICITPENQISPWIMFESGALSKTLDQTYVCPLVFDMTPSELTSPLSQFQARTCDKEGIYRLIKTINTALNNRSLKDEELEEIFNVWWPQLELKLNETPIYEGVKVKERSTDDILKELVDNTREQLRREEVRIEKNKEFDEKLDFFVGHLETIKKMPIMLNSMISKSNNLLSSINPDVKLTEIQEGDKLLNDNFLSELIENVQEMKKNNQDLRKSIMNKPEETN